MFKLHEWDGYNQSKYYKSADVKNCSMGVGPDGQILSLEATEMVKKTISSKINIDRLSIGNMTIHESRDLIKDQLIMGLTAEIEKEVCKEEKLEQELSEALEVVEKQNTHIKKIHGRLEKAKEVYDKQKEEIEKLQAMLAIEQAKQQITFNPQPHPWPYTYTGTGEDTYITSGGSFDFNSSSCDSTSNVTMADVKEMNKTVSPPIIMAKPYGGFGIGEADEDIINIAEQVLAKSKLKKDK